MHRLLGVNLPPVTDYSQTPVFVNLMEQARRFGTPDAPWDEKALLGEDGWPVGDFGVVLLTGQERVPGTAGVYHVQFEGRARVQAVASPAEVRPAQYNPVRGLTQLEVVMPPGAGQLMLRFTGTGPGIRKLRVLRPGYDPAHPPRFTRLFLQHIAGMRTLRAMDWVHANGNTQRHWSDRSDPERTQHLGRAGVPWERVIELANTNGSDLWINIPVAADDDYVRQLALLLRQRLRPGLRLYLEYSNEVWNAGFAQFHDNLRLTRRTLEARPDSPLRHDGENDINRLATRHVAERLWEISNIFRSVYGAAANDVLRPVLATQAVQPALLQLQLDYLQAVHGPVVQYLHAVAIAPYFNLGPQQETEGLETGQVLDAMEASLQRLERQNQFETHLALARWHGLQALAYEGGSDTFGPGSIEAKRAAQLHPRMAVLCRQYLDRWHQAGGGMFLWFQAGAGDWRHRFGAWELTESINDTTAPKLRCLRDWQPPPPTPPARNALPDTLAALDFVGSHAPYTTDARNRLRHLRPGRSVDYRIWAPQTRRYTLQLLAAAAQSGNAVRLALDGQVVRARLELPAQGWERPVAGEEVAITLEAGWHVLRLTTVAHQNGFDLRALHWR